MSEIRADKLHNASGDNDSGIDLSTNDQVKIKTANTTRLTVASDGTVQVNDVNLDLLDTDGDVTGRFRRSAGTNSVIIEADPDNSASSSSIQFRTDATERLRITNDYVLVGKTSQSVGSTGAEIDQTGRITATRDGDTVLRLNRLTSNGTIIQMRKDGTVVGEIGVINGNNLTVGGLVSGHGGIQFGNNNVTPMSAGSEADNLVDLGASNLRYDDIYATNSSIQTSDQQEKNTIEDSDLGLDFVKRLSPKSYIFNGKTRTHYGLIAQDVETVLSDINKPTSGFAGFVKDDISEEQDGSSYRYGLRYTEFVAPLIKAIKEQQTIIENLQARIEALENA